MLNHALLVWVVKGTVHYRHKKSRCKGSGFSQLRNGPMACC